MPTGIILKSGSYDADGDQGRQEKLEEVIEEKAGYELAEPESNNQAAEVEGEAATHVETFPARRPSRKERAIERATAPLLEKIKQLEAGGPQRAAQAEAVAVRPKPQRGEFYNNEAYEDALVAWGTEKALADKALQDTQTAERQWMEQNLRNYGAQLKESKQAHPDWDQLKKRFDEEDVFIGQGAQLAILEQENGAEVTYYLMRHPAEAKRLGEM